MGEKHSVPNEGASDNASLMKISNTVFQKLTCDGAPKQEVTRNEEYWINKLAALDQEHTNTNGLNIDEAEKILNYISEYTNIKAERRFPVDTTRVTTCLQDNVGNTLACDVQIAQFKKSVDKSLHDAVSGDTKDVRKKKESYMETFERTH